MTLTAGDIAQAVEGRLLAGDPDRGVAGFSLDTRTLAPGDLFFALRGPRFDGRQFIPSAIERGACGVVIQGRAALPTAPPDRPPPIVVAVDDTIGALQSLARHVRRASGTRVIAITGSAGKTTTKEITAEFLAARYRVFRNQGNLNNHIGLPLSLLELRHRPDVAVVELGMNHPGEIRTLIGIAEPEVRVWTNVGAAHLEFFPSIDAIADAKAEILELATTDAIVVANGDDPRIQARIAAFPGRRVTFGFTAGADVTARNVRELGIDGTVAELWTPRGRAVLRVPLLGLGNLANVLAAAAVALELDVPVAVIVERAAGLKPSPRRGEIVRLRRGIVVIDDSYNSNPSALTAVLKAVGGEHRFPRRLAMIGEMLELGGRSSELHEACGRAAATAGLHRLLTVGGAPARALAAAAVAGGMPPDQVAYYETSEAAADAAARVLEPGDLVLVKGSRGIRMDIVVDRVKAEWA